MKNELKLSEQRRALGAAVAAAQSAGKLIRRNLHSAKKVNEETSHDIKLELDVQCQRRIERMLRAEFPSIPLLGEEGSSGGSEGPHRWVVDPIDGTVNFSYGIPHACVSIALQQRAVENPTEVYETIVAVVYEPFCDELWTAIKGQPARLNARIIRVSKRGKLAEAVVSTGFAKTSQNLDAGLPYFNKLIRRVRKVRMMGAAALSLTYVASGRFDAYVESGVHLWDVAAGGLIVECAGGEFWRESLGGHSYRILASNGLLRRQLQAIR